jgi:predicted alpha/beta-hydrolase family hydrolase
MKDLYGGLFVWYDYDMNLLLLPGNSKRHKSWVREAEQALATRFELTAIHDYDHWDTDREFADLDLEINRLRNEVTDLKPYVIFAKSIGSILAVKGIAEKALEPAACIFAGFPFKILNEQGLEEVSEWLNTVEVPVLIIQNENDPMGSWDEVNTYVRSLTQSDIHVVVNPGDTHDYTDFERIKELMDARFL